jgi:ribulose-phosphate 3-epimerase
VAGSAIFSPGKTERNAVEFLRLARAAESERAAAQSGQEV